jgi:hypothetical protein
MPKLNALASVSPSLDIGENTLQGKFPLSVLLIVLKYLIGNSTAPSQPSPIDLSQPGKAEERESLPGRSSTGWETNNDLDIAKREYKLYLDLFKDLSGRNADPVAVYLAEQDVKKSARILDWIKALDSRPIDQPNRTTGDPGSPTYSEFGDIPPMDL